MNTKHDMGEHMGEHIGNRQRPLASDSFYWMIMALNKILLLTYLLLTWVDKHTYRDNADQY